MITKILAGVSAVALGVMMAAPALADDDEGTKVEAEGVGGGAMLAGKDASIDSHDVFSAASYTAVSTQTLAATTVGVALDLTGIGVPVLSGNAVIGDRQQQYATGVVQASANTGMSAVSQQGASIAAVGSVGLGACCR